MSKPKFTTEALNKNRRRRSRLTMRDYPKYMMALDLHDSVKQCLAGINLMANTAKNRITNDPDAAQAKLTEIQRVAVRAYNEMTQLYAVLFN